tara:strand:+ start:203 stop:739 length:537 start_codon:yes stop_codon:yes gene_type:complete
MILKKTNIADCVILYPEVYEDERGFFLETHNEKNFQQLIMKKITFVQDNFSRSKYNVLRGLHFQKNKPQGKLVRVTHGEVFDVAVDLRKDSKTFGKFECVTLSAENKKQFFIPEGFAHGFQVLSDYADFEYKCTNYYDPNDERSLRWDDPEISIEWPLENPIISEKDNSALFLKDIDL